jgi:phage I-like protein
VPLYPQPTESGVPALDTQQRTAALDKNAMAGSADDARMREAMRLIVVFLAIEDSEASTALIALAERLVTHDWLKKVQRHQS